jgi:hypothetical protein
MVDKAICTTAHFPPTSSAANLYEKIRQSARERHLIRNLPQDYRVLNESRPTPAREYPTPQGGCSVLYDNPPPYSSILPLSTRAPRHRGSLTEDCEEDEARNSPEADRDCETTCRLLWFGMHFLQFVMAAAVAGLYGVDITNDLANEPCDVDSRWVYAVVMAALSMVASLIHIWLLCLRKLLVVTEFIGDSILLYVFPFHLTQDCRLFADRRLPYSLLWLVLFGIFGKIYIGGGHTGRMNHAVWVDLLNLFLWLFTAGWRGGQCWGRRRMSAHVDPAFHTFRIV